MHPSIPTVGQFLGANDHHRGRACFLNVEVPLQTHRRPSRQIICPGVARPPEPSPLEPIPQVFWSFLVDPVTVPARASGVSDFAYGVPEDFMATAALVLSSFQTLNPVSKPFTRRDMLHATSYTHHPAPTTLHPTPYITERFHGAFSTDSYALYTDFITRPAGGCQALPRGFGSGDNPKCKEN